jgi:hypothetical protein
MAVRVACGALPPAALTGAPPRDAPACAAAVHLTAPRQCWGACFRAAAVPDPHPARLLATHVYAKPVTRSRHRIRAGRYASHARFSQQTIRQPWPTAAPKYGRTVKSAVSRPGRSGLGKARRRKASISSTVVSRYPVAATPSSRNWRSARWMVGSAAPTSPASSVCVNGQRITVPALHFWPYRTASSNRTLANRVGTSQPVKSTRRAVALRSLSTTPRLNASAASGLRPRKPMNSPCPITRAMIGPAVETVARRGRSAHRTHHVMEYRFRWRGIVKLCKYKASLGGPLIPCLRPDEQRSGDQTGTRSQAVVRLRCRPAPTTSG